MGIFDFSTKKKPISAQEQPKPRTIGVQPPTIRHYQMNLVESAAMEREDVPAIIESDTPMKKSRRAKVDDENVLSRRITIRITDREYDILEDYSQRTGGSISANIRKLIKNYLDI